MDCPTCEVLKMQIVNQAHYIECLLAEIKQLKDAK